MVAGTEETILGGDLLALRRPAQAAVHRLATLLLGARPRRALINDHRDVRAEIGLDRHHFLRAEENLGAVEVRRERDAVLADVAELREAESLEATAVGQDRTGPTH